MSPRDTERDQVVDEILNNFDGLTQAEWSIISILGDCNDVTEVELDLLKAIRDKLYT